jgi:hypothetical protein
MRLHHKEKAREDGVMDFSDEETYAQDEDEYAPQQQAKKIDILSNISRISAAHEGNVCYRQQ